MNMYGHNCTNVQWESIFVPQASEAYWVWGISAYWQTPHGLTFVWRKYNINSKLKLHSKSAKYICILYFAFVRAKLWISCTEEGGTG